VKIHHAEPAAPAPSSSIKDEPPSKRPPLKGLTYSEGRAALSPSVQRKEGDGSDAEKEKERAKKARESYEKLLGKFLGGKLYDLVISSLSADKILDYGNKGIDAAVDGATGLIKPTDGAGGVMDEAAEAEAVKAFAAALGGWASAEAKAWLKSSDGQKFRQNAAEWLEEHPGVIVGAIGCALLAAAGAVVSNMDVPEIEKKFKLGDQLTANVGVDPAGIRDLMLNSATAGLSYKAKDVEANVAYKYTRNEEGDDTHAVSAGVTANVGAHVSTSASASYDGDKLVVDTTAGYETTAFGASGGVSHSEDDDDRKTLGNVSVRIGDQEDNVTADAEYDFETGALSVGVARLMTMEGGSLSHSVRNNDGTMVENVDARTTMGPVSMHGNATRDMGTGDVTRASMGLGYETKDKLKLDLDYSMVRAESEVLSVSAGKEWGEYSLSGSADYSLKDAELQALGARFGFRDENEFKGFLIDYKRSYSDKIATDKLNLMVEFSVRDLMIRGTNNTVMTDGNLSSNMTGLHAGYAVNDNWTVIGGGRYGYQPEANNPMLSDRDRGAWLEVGAQYKNVPLVIGWRPEDNSVSFGVVIPFGR